MSVNQGLANYSPWIWSVVWFNMVPELKIVFSFLLIYFSPWASKLHCFIVNVALPPIAIYVDHIEPGHTGDLGML